MSRRRAFALTALAIICFICRAQAQVGTGQYPLGTFDSLGPDVINVGNLNLMLGIPVLHKAGRAGTNFTYDLGYNGAIWASSTGAWVPVQNWGWSGETEVVTGYLFERTTTTFCQNDGKWPIIQTLGVTYYDAQGIAHRFAGHIKQSFGQCPGDTDTLSNTWSIDGQYKIGSGGYPLTSKIGVELDPPTNSLAGAGYYIDANGNKITSDGSGHFTDTTGNTALTISGTAPSPQSYTYTDSSGTSRSITVSYVARTVQTNFGCPGVAEFNGTSVPLVDTITLADTSTYHFTYEDTTPGVSSIVTGRLASITVPAGGVITYSYTGANGGINCADGSALGLTRTLTSATGSPVRAYTRTVSGLNSHTLVVDAVGTHLDYDFVTGSDATGGEGVYQTNLSVTNGGAGTPILAQQTCYNGVAKPCTTQSLTLPATNVQQYNTWDGVTQDGSSSMYDSAGNLLSTSLFDYGSATSRGPALGGQGFTYTGGLLTSSSVSIGGGTVSNTNYTYDGASLHATSGMPQHLSGRNSGNITQVSVLLDPGVNSTALTSTYSYYDTGSLYSQTSPSGGTTQYAYDSATNTYPITFTPPDPHGVGMASTLTYDAYQGQLASAMSPNGTLASISLSDGLGHPSQVLTTSGGTTVAKVTGQSSPTQSTQTTYQGPSVASETDTYYDSYGRSIRTSTKSDASNYYVSDTCYDAAGRVGFQSYPYKTATLGPQVCSGLGDLYSYDALGRTLSITHGDSLHTSKSFTYYGNSTKVTDENAVAHIYQINGAGQLTIACELTSIPFNGLSPISCGTLYAGTGFVTSYAYTNRAVKITQGSQLRSFTLDGAGRPTSKQEPEGNFTFYNYSSNSTGNVVARVTPKAGQTDGSGNPGTTTTATTQYDQLGRAISTTYDDGITPTKTFTYDVAPSGSTFNVGYAKGLMTSASTTAGASTQFSYDALGRVQNTSQCIPGWCSGTNPPAFTRSYGHDWAGNAVSEQYGTGSGIATLGYTVNLAGQVVTVTGGQDTSLTTLYSATTVTPLGPTATSFGNGVTASLTYDPLGHGTGLGLVHGSTALYAYTAQWSGQHITTSSDSVNGSGSYGYDTLNHLNTAVIGSAAGTLNMTWTYDRYGNRMSQSATGSYIGTLTQPTFSVDETTNHITSSGYTYDAVGNLWTGAGATYTYDAEGNVTAISGGISATFTYDALNERVLTTINGTTRAYGFNVAGQRATMWDGTGHLLSAQYYAGGAPLAYYLASDGHVRFEHQDWVGTQRFRTTYTGAVEGSFTSLPFGDSQATASGSDTDAAHVSVLDTDSADLKHANFREYSSTQGRWTRPDPYGGSYDFANPQSFNRYSYVLQQPLSLVDPEGLNYIDPDGRLCVTWTTMDGNVLVSNVMCGSGGTSVPTGSSGSASVLVFGAQGGVGAQGAAPNAPNNENKNPFLCGSEAAGKISLAGGLSHVPGFKSGVGNFIANAVGGNAFSGATDLIHSVATGEGGGHSVFYNMGQSVIAGPTQGFGAAFGGSVGKAIEESPWGADIVSVGLKALPLVGEYASGIGEAKLIYDGVTYFGATAGCALGIVH